MFLDISEISAFSVSGNQERIQSFVNLKLILHLKIKLKIKPQEQLLKKNNFSYNRERIRISENVDDG